MNQSDRRHRASASSSTPDNGNNGSPKEAQSGTPLSSTPGGMRHILSFKYGTPPTISRQSRASVSPRQSIKRDHPQESNESSSASESSSSESELLVTAIASTPVNRPPAAGYSTPQKNLRQQHPPGWERITWAPKVNRRAVSRFHHGEIAAH